MNDIDIRGMSDHDIIVMMAQKLNDHCDIVTKHEKTLYNNGYGIATQVKILWLVACGSWGVFLVLLSKVGW